MTTIQCPFCGEIMNVPLKFCTSCGRGVSQADIQKIGLKIQKGADGTKRLDNNNHIRSFDLSRKSYSFHRQVRTLFYTVSLVLFLTIGYYVTMRFFLHEHLPYQVDVMLEKLLDKSKQ